ncbi:MAG: hypothetical protein RIT14_1432 [Pseudomonadota bacterium]|jgi:hypothetical protein
MPPRPTPPFPPIDVAPLIDMARSLRFVAERSGRTLKNSLPGDALPAPAARLADGALTRALRLGETAQRGVSGLAHMLLNRDAPPPPLTAPDADQAERRFAAAAHDGLRLALFRLGAEGVLASETAARQAWRQVFSAGAMGSEGETAAALVLALDTSGALRETLWPDTATLSLAEARRIAIFAVLLAMLDDPADFRLRLDASVDIACALRDDLCAAADAAALATLFEEFRTHV